MGRIGIEKDDIPRVFEDARISVRWDPWRWAVLAGVSSPLARGQGLALHYEAIPVLGECHEVAPLVEAGEHLYAVISNTGGPDGFTVAEVLEEPILMSGESDADAMRRRAAAVAQHVTRVPVEDPSIVLEGLESTAQGASREWRHEKMRTPNTRELETSNTALADSGVVIAHMAYSPEKGLCSFLGRDEVILRILTGLPLVVSETFTKHDDVAEHPPTILPAHELAFSTDEARDKSRAWNGWAQTGHWGYGWFCDQAGAAPFTLFEWASQGARDAEEASTLPAWFPPAVVHDWTALEAVCSQQAGELDNDSGIPSGSEARRTARDAMRRRALDIARTFNGDRPAAFLRFDENLAVMPEGEAPMWEAASRIDDEKDTPRIRVQKRKMFVDSVLERATGAALAACEPGTLLRDSTGRPRRAQDAVGWDSKLVDFSNEKRRATAMGFLSALRGLRFDSHVGRSGAAPSPAISVLAGILLGINRTVEDRGAKDRGPFTGRGSTAVRAAGLAISALLWPVDGASKMRIGRNGVFGAIEDCSSHSAASLGFLWSLAASGSVATATRDDYERHRLAVKTAEGLGSTSPEDVPFINPAAPGAFHGAAFRNTTGAGIVAVLAADSTTRILELLPNGEGEDVLVRFLTESVLLEPDCADALVWRWNERIGVEAATRLLPKITHVLQGAEEAVLEEARSQAAH